MINGFKAVKIVKSSTAISTVSPKVIPFAMRSRTTVITATVDQCQSEVAPSICIAAWQNCCSKDLGSPSINTICCGLLALELVRVAFFRAM